MKGAAARRAIIALHLCASIAAGLWAETSEHQRVGLRRLDLDSFSADLDIELAPVGLDLPRLGLDLAFGASLHDGIILGLTLPVTLSPQERPVGGVAWKLEGFRPDLFAAMSFRTGSWAYSAGLEFSCGTGLERVPGRAELGITLDAHRYLDPLLIGGGLALCAGLPWKEGGVLVSRPLSVLLCLSLTEAVNANVSLSVGFNQGLSGPRLVAGAWEPGGWAWTSGFSLRVVVVGDAWAFRAGIANASSPRYRFGLSRMWKAQTTDQEPVQ
jgi:hypothetical protein